MRFFRSNHIGCRLCILCFTRAMMMRRVPRATPRQHSIGGLAHHQMPAHRLLESPSSLWPLALIASHRIRRISRSRYSFSCTHISFDLEVCFWWFAIVVECSTERSLWTTSPRSKHVSRCNIPFSCITHLFVTWYDMKLMSQVIWISHHTNIVLIISNHYGFLCAYPSRVFPAVILSSSSLSL